MNDALRVATAATFVWLGMVLAISFLEAPLKFRAPGVSVQVGLGIGRIVFRALNLAEIGWAIVIGVCLLIDSPSTSIVVTALIAFAILLAQLGIVRPRLSRRSDRILTGGDAPRSHAHYVYIALETIKVVVLVVLGGYLLSV
jgi:hypothetical protein